MSSILYLKDVQQLLDEAKYIATKLEHGYLQSDDLFWSIIANPRSRLLFERYSHRNVLDLLSFVPVDLPLGIYKGEYRLDENCKEIINKAIKWAESCPDLTQPGSVNLKHIVLSILTDQVASRWIENFKPLKTEKAEEYLNTHNDKDVKDDVINLYQNVGKLKDTLTQKIFGQEYAISEFVNGLFNAEFTASIDEERRAPKAIFVFAGPSGVGKTYMAETGAKLFQKPFKRFDMSSFSSAQQAEMLMGSPKMYQGAQPGLLTDFVDKNPDAILLFDEVEKAHLKTIHCFLQILDAGILEDKYLEKNVVFRNTIIVFTTNAGRKLYDHFESKGSIAKNSQFPKKAIIDALENEKDAYGQEIFPKAICSRLSTGYLILFNHLNIVDLARIAKTGLEKVAREIGYQLERPLTFDALLPLILVLKEGIRSDARSIRAQSEIFLKRLLHDFFQLNLPENLEDYLEMIDNIQVSIESDSTHWAKLIKDFLFPDLSNKKVLIVCSLSFKEFIHEEKFGVKVVHNFKEYFMAVEKETYDLLIMDIYMDNTLDNPITQSMVFDAIPGAAKVLERGQLILDHFNKNFPDIPVYILNEKVTEDRSHSGLKPNYILTVKNYIINGTLEIKDLLPEKIKSEFNSKVLSILQMEQQLQVAGNIGQEQKILNYDYVPRLDKERRNLNIELRNFRLETSVSTNDLGHILDEIDRPKTRFDDVIGAEEAKNELRFFIDFIQNPKELQRKGIKAPRGILLYGPPGTGKTMLARALAGESGIAFIECSASSFVTIWQGSGPQNIRDLFQRARKYAPAIIFIDEIDAIGKPRTGGKGASEANENTLNALLTEMDGFKQDSVMKPVFVIAATNVEVSEQDSSALDPALLRRFSRLIRVDLPDRHARFLFLKKNAGNYPTANISDDTLKSIAERSTGMNLAQLQQVFDASSRRSWELKIDIDDSLLEKVFEDIRFGSTNSINIEARTRTAWHEAGHAILYILSGNIPDFITIVSRGNYGGYMARSAKEIEEKGSMTKSQILDIIRVSLGGRAAELVIYGEEGGLTTGASSDLQNATRYARHLVTYYGMDPDYGLSVQQSNETYIGELAFRLTNKYLAAELNNACSQLKENYELFKKLTDGLIEKEHLKSVEIIDIVKPYINLEIHS
jgi:cell division protease FtsH